MNWRTDWRKHPYTQFSQYCQRGPSSTEILYNIDHGALPEDREVMHIYSRCLCTDWMGKDYLKRAKIPGKHTAQLLPDNLVMGHWTFCCLSFHVSTIPSGHMIFLHHDYLLILIRHIPLFPCSSSPPKLRQILLLLFLSCSSSLLDAFTTFPHRRQ